MLLRISLFCIILLSTVSLSHVYAKCGQVQVKKQNQLVFNGTRSYHGQWPWLASLFQFENRYICGSSIITRWHLLTAAHCVIAGIDDIYALLGRFKLSNSTEDQWQRRSMSEVFIHKDYNKSNTHHLSKGDIAIFRVSREIEYTKYIQPICLPATSANIINVTGFIAGYGIDAPIGEHQDVSSFVEFKSIDVMDCLDSVRNYNSVVSRHSFCAGKTYGTACQGDSGGGFYVYNVTSLKYSINGILSHGIGNCNPRESVTFVNVPSFITWIHEIISPLDPCAIKDCSGREECVVVNKQAKCICQSGFTGISPNCKPKCANDISCFDNEMCINNECIEFCSSQEGWNLCEENAQCVVENHQSKCKYLLSGRHEYKYESYFCIYKYCNEYLAFNIDSTTSRAETYTEIGYFYSPGFEMILFDGLINKANYLPVNVYKILPNIKFYKVAYQSIVEITRENFERLKLKKLVIMWNFAYLNISENAFDDLNELEELSLWYCGISSLSDNIFDSLKRIEKIDLSWNEISSLSEIIFRNLSTLKIIKLQFNKLTTLSANIFKHNLQLEEIDLYWNWISSLSVNIFNDKTNLKKVCLARNVCINKNYKNYWKNDEKNALIDDLTKNCGN